ncbi:MAG TPA: cryptochrome/photolyase family protein, partial [Flavobacteriales bacterium]|nr:cryptochrome/photolyase family protein [Flavobacteriales bacterium]
MESKFFVILGNQLFDPKILKKNNCNEVFMAEDYELCTYFKHHKLKLFLFLTAMREYRDELKNKSISVNYFELSNRKVNETYIDCLIKFLKDRGILEINIFEIEDTSFEKHFLKA